MTSQTSHQPSDLTKGQVKDSWESCGTLKSLPGTCGQVCPSPWEVAVTGAVCWPDHPGRRWSLGRGG